VLGFRTSTSGAGCGFGLPSVGDSTRCGSCKFHPPQKC
jgi:hypothetical protein